MWQQMAKQNRKMKTNVNEMVARHLPKISPTSKPGGCVKYNMGEWKLNTKELSSYCYAHPCKAKTLATKRLSKWKTFVESVRVNGSNFKDETLFLFFATIITAKNWGDGTNFHVRKRMIDTIKISGDRFVNVSIS